MRIDHDQEGRKDNARVPAVRPSMGSQESRQVAEGLPIAQMQIAVLGRSEEGKETLAAITTGRPSDDDAKKGHPVTDRITPSCVTCCRWSENMPECQYEREQGRTVCEFWPDNNLPEKVRD